MHLCRTRHNCISAACTFTWGSWPYKRSPTIWSVIVVLLYAHLITLPRRLANFVLEGNAAISAMVSNFVVYRY